MIDNIFISDWKAKFFINFVLVKKWMIIFLSAIEERNFTKTYDTFFIAWFYRFLNNFERSNEQWTWSSLSDQKERNFRVRLEIKRKKNRRKKTIFFFKSLERPLNINIFVCYFIRSLGIGKWDKIGGESSENAKKTWFYNF